MPLPASPKEQTPFYAHMAAASAASPDFAINLLHTPSPKQKQSGPKFVSLPAHALPFADAFVTFEGDEGIVSETLALSAPGGNSPPSRLGRAPRNTAHTTPFASRVDVVVTYFASGFLFGHGGSTFQSVLAKCDLGVGDEFRVGSGFQNTNQVPSPGYRKPHRLFEVGERAAPKVLGFLRCIINTYRRLVYLHLASGDVSARESLTKLKGRPVAFATFLRIVNANPATALLPAAVLARAEAGEAHTLVESERHVVRILQALADVKFTYLPPLATKDGARVSSHFRQHAVEG